MSFVADLEPRALWSHFDKILTIPRGSKEEDQIRDHVVAVAERNGLEYQVDGVGNVVIKKPGAPGKEGAPATILQSHLDMVNEKNSDVEHDFSKDAIRPIMDGEYLTADGTTLGSDNGIGVAAMLAILEAEDLTHGPLEFLFTIDEETGLTGAGGLESSLLQGRTLLNLDSEEEGTVTVGCAGGADTEIRLALQTIPAPSNCSTFKVKLHGLKGGHSGIDIHLQKGNAIQLLARMIHAISHGTPGFMAGIQGGNMHNAIPREAWATVVIPDDQSGDFLLAIGQQYEVVKEEYGTIEPGMEFSMEEVPAPAEVWTTFTTWDVLRLLVALPHGVVTMSNDIPGLVETSTNLAVAKSEGDVLRILTSSRSSVASSLRWIRQKIRAIAYQAKAEVEEHDGYPGWKPDLSSAVLQVVKSVHTRILGEEPHVQAVHAGLECGIIGEMIPGMDMISFGPQIEFPHSPNERV
ncbi:MAG: aminoacyl-histidine dipeptidase, partial [Longimicrobiales bacterium]|nr:aminoacyl-histidine dipeptidase [Longimicrobiales bacterium]